MNNFIRKCKCLIIFLYLLLNYSNIYAIAIKDNSANTSIGYALQNQETTAREYKNYHGIYSSYKHPYNENFELDFMLRGGLDSDDNYSKGVKLLNHFGVISSYLSFSYINYIKLEIGVGINQYLYYSTLDINVDAVNHSSSYFFYDIGPSLLTGISFGFLPNGLEISLKSSYSYILRKRKNEFLLFFGINFYQNFFT